MTSAGAATARPEIPAALLGGLLLAGGFMAFTAWDQSYWWRVKEDYSFGWLVPLFVAYLVHDRWPRLLGCLQSRRAGDHSGARPPALLTGFALVAVAGGAVLFLTGAFYRAAAGPTHFSTLTITLGMAALVLPTLYLLAPGSAADRRAAAGLFVFPTLLWLVSAPLLSVIENNLNVFLMRQVTTVVFSLFDLLGFPLLQRGNVLVLPTGNVGVEEACSGIRSLTGCFFAGSFLAAVFLRSRWKQAALMAASLVFAFAANLLRSVFLTSWAYRHGAKSIEGTVHDLSGYSVLALTVVALLAHLPLLHRRPDRRPRSSPVSAG